MTFMTTEQFKKVQEETKQMDAARKWIDTFSKMDIARQQSGMGSLNSQTSQPSDPVEKVSRMMEKKMEMDMMKTMYEEVFTGKKEQKQSGTNIMDSFNALLAANPEAAREFLDSLDESSIQKISMLSNPDPNAQLLRTMVSKGGAPKKESELSEIFGLYKNLVDLQKSNTPQPVADPLQQTVLALLMKVVDNSMSKPSGNSSDAMIMEFLRTMNESSKEEAKLAREEARINAEKFNQLMITVLTDKVEESKHAPGLIDQLSHLGQSMEMLKTLGMGNGTRSIEELKLGHEQEKWRMEQQASRAQQEMIKSIIEQGMDRVADIMTTPAVQEFASAAGGKVSNRIQDMKKDRPMSNANVELPEDPVDSYPSAVDFAAMSFGDINNQEVPITIPRGRTFGNNGEIENV